MGGCSSKPSVRVVSVHSPSLGHKDAAEIQSPEVASSAFLKTSHDQRVVCLMTSSAGKVYAAYPDHYRKKKATQAQLQKVKQAHEILAQKSDPVAAFHQEQTVTAVGTTQNQPQQEKTPFPPEETPRPESLRSIPNIIPGSSRNTTDTTMVSPSPSLSLDASDRRTPRRKRSELTHSQESNEEETSRRRSSHNTMEMMAAAMDFLKQSERSGGIQLDHSSRRDSSNKGSRPSKRRPSRSDVQAMTVAAAMELLQQSERSQDVLESSERRQSENHRRTSHRRHHRKDPLRNSHHNKRSKSKTPAYSKPKIQVENIDLLQKNDHSGGILDSLDRHEDDMAEERRGDVNLDIVTQDTELPSVEGTAGPISSTKMPPILPHSYMQEENNKNGRIQTQVEIEKVPSIRQTPYATSLPNEEDEKPEESGVNNSTTLKSCPEQLSSDDDDFALTKLEPLATEPNTAPGTSVSQKSPLASSGGSSSGCSPSGLSLTADVGSIQVALAGQTTPTSQETDIDLGPLRPNNSGNASSAGTSGNGTKQPRKKRGFLLKSPDAEKVKQMLKEADTSTYDALHLPLHVQEPLKVDPPSMDRLESKQGSVDSTLDDVWDAEVNELDGPWDFKDIQDKEFLRLCKRLHKKINLNPWDKFNGFDDAEISDFVSNHPETCRVRYSFDNFSGQLFPLSVVCAMGASRESMRSVWEAYKPALLRCDVWVGTPLHYACSHQASESVIRFLARREFSMLSKRNHFGRTPLHMACIFKAALPAVRSLVKLYPPAVQVQDRDGHTPVHLACENGCSFEILKTLLDVFPEPCGLTESTEKGMTPLHIACCNNASKVVIQALVDHCPGATQIFDREGNLPLHHASEYNLPTESINILVSACPESIEVPNRKGRISFELARRKHLPKASLSLLEPTN